MVCDITVTDVSILAMWHVCPYDCNDTLVCDVEVDDVTDDVKLTKPVSWFVT